MTRTYRVKKTLTFDAAHCLPEHGGKCRNLHGHTYKVTLEFVGSYLENSGPSAGMLIDFGEVHSLFEAAWGHLDHSNLNDHFNYPTAENMAREIYERLRDLKGPGWPRIASVTVQETEDCSATYEED